MCANIHVCAALSKNAHWGHLPTDVALKSQTPGGSGHTLYSSEWKWKKTRVWNGGIRKLVLHLVFGMQRQKYETWPWRSCWASPHMHGFDMVSNFHWLSLQVPRRYQLHVFLWVAGTRRHVCVHAGEDPIAPRFWKHLSAPPWWIMY